jgi:precorrin-6Y C5,15-methyltransferase (decarboxylating)
MADWTLGIPDDEFEQRKPRRGLITKAEVRVVSLAKLCLRPDSTVWDIGTGSGSVAIEAARIARQGRVYAIEKNPEDCAIARRNCEKFGTANVTVVEGRAPEGLDTWPDPDGVFIGGSGGEMAEIIALACRRLREGGRVVVNAATIETLYGAVQALKAQEFAVDIVQVQVARSRPILHLTRFEALDPVFIITGRRPTPEEVAAAATLRAAKEEEA